MAKTRVALCITELERGGAERCLTELAIRMDRKRFAPVVYCLAPPPARENASFLPTLLAAGVEVHCLGGRGIWQFPMVLRRLKHLLLAQNPHIVQTFLFHANILGRIAGRRSGAKAIVAGVRVAERAAKWHLWADRLTQRWVDRYVCVSQSVADFSAAQTGIPCEKLLVIPNGIDVAKYPAPKPADLTQFGIPAGHRVIVFVGRLERQKGVDWLIETAPRWLEPLSDCDLLIVGQGPQRASLEATAKGSEIAGRLHFAGWRVDVPDILAASHLLVLPSAWEGMPNVVLEAMASRLPVVASDVEGVRELLGPLAASQTVPYRQSQLLIEKIVSIMRGPEAAVELGIQNRRRVEEHFDIGRVVNAYEELWESLARG
jgi:glycosyltransferase involved in cell wall biosynthesis